MSARPVGGLFAGGCMAAAGAFRQTNPQPVWRSSFDIDDLRAQVGKPFGDGSMHQARAVIDAIIETAEVWADKLKATAQVEAKAKAEADGKGKAAPQTHQLTQNALKTLRRTLEKYMDYATGACQPSLDMIADAAAFSRITVIRHLKVLRDLKWFDWVWRTEPTGNSPKDGPTLKQATNAYFFEISRLPLDAQIYLRQILKRRGIRLNEHADRKGSGAVPNRVARLASRVAQGMNSAFAGKRRRAETRALIDEAAFVRGETEMMGTLPIGQWALLRHPDDLAAQEAYNRRLGIDHSMGASISSSLVSPPTEQE